MSFSFIFQDFGHVLTEVLTAIVPVLVLFLIFLLVFKLPLKMLLTLLRGILFAFAGLALFLQGVKIGFLPVGNEMGAILGGLPHRWVLIPLGFILGFVATLAEPAVRILSNQVEKSSTGSIRANTIIITLCLAVGVFTALGMTRVVYGIPFYYIIIPGYLLAIILMIFSKPSFTAIAFDSGGVATGPMTVTFIMALAIGAADQIEGRDAVIDGFGLIALVALAPIILVMLLGFFYPVEEIDLDEAAEAQSSEQALPTPESPEKPAAPTKQEGPEGSEASEAPTSPAKQERPEASEAPEAPEAPEAAEASEASEAPRKQEGPEAPEASETPAAKTRQEGSEESSAATTPEISTDGGDDLQDTAPRIEKESENH